MKFNIAENIKEHTQELIVGNVYNVRGGRGARQGHMHIIVSLTDTGVVTLTVNNEGEIVGSGCYAKHYFEEKCPMAFCAGIEDMSFNITCI